MSREPLQGQISLRTGGASGIGADIAVAIHHVTNLIGGGGTPFDPEFPNGR